MSFDLLSIYLQIHTEFQAEFKISIFKAILDRNPAFARAGFRSKIGFKMEFNFLHRWNWLEIMYLLHISSKKIEISIFNQF